MAIGPRDRNYNVTLKDHYYWDQRSLKPLGSWFRQVDATVTARSGSLTVNNPWRASKPDVPTPTARSLEHRHLENVRGSTRFVGNSEYWRHGVFAGQGTDAVNVGIVSQRADLVNRAVLSALTKLKDQKWNAGVCIAEAEGVARLLEDGAKTAKSIHDFLHRGSWQQAYNRFRMHNPRYHSYPTWRKKYWDEVKHIESVRRAKLVPEGWLYYHYGLKPTVNDIDGALTELILKVRTNPNLLNGKVMGYAKVKHSGLTLSNHDTLVCRLESAAIESVRVVLHVSAKEGIGAKLSTLGATNPAEAVWNRIPFSFLVDYFVGVGEWLHVLDAWVGWDFGDWEESWRLNHTVKIVPSRSETAKLGPLTEFLLSPGYFNHKSIDRVIHNTLYGPMANVVPRVKIPSLNQTASILSLLATAFKRTVRP